MERKFYVAKKDCYDALSYDTLVKACAAAGVNADGLVQFSRFEIDGLSDDGFEKCKGLFYDAFSDELYENELDMGDAKIFAFDNIRRDDERLESAVKIACGETVGVKSAKIVAAYGLKDEDRDVFENALKIRFGTGEEKGNLSFDEKVAKAEIQKVFESENENHCDFAQKVFNENIAKISNNCVKFSKNFDRIAENSQKNVIEKTTSDGQSVAVRAFSGSVESALIKAFSVGFAPVSAVVTTCFSKDNESCFRALENAKRTADYLSRANVGAFSESFVNDGQKSFDRTVSVVGVKKLDMQSPTPSATADGCCAASCRAERRAACSVSPTAATVLCRSCPCSAAPSSASAMRAASAACSRTLRETRGRIVFPFSRGSARCSRRADGGSMCQSALPYPRRACSSAPRSPAGKRSGT